MRTRFKKFGMEFVDDLLIVALDENTTPTVEELAKRLDSIGSNCSLSLLSADRSEKCSFMEFKISDKCYLKNLSSY